jgi:hypothetical protein
MSSEIKANKWSPATGTAATLGDSSDTFTVPSGVTLDIASGATIDATGATITGWPSGTENQPNFQMRTSADLAWINSAYTKIPLNTLEWESDTGSCDTTTNYRFTVPTGKGGKYFLSHHMPLPTGGNGYVKILKNGSELGNFWYTWASDFGGIKTFSMSAVADLAASDYLEWWVYSSANDTVNGNYYITGWRLDT